MSEKWLTEESYKSLTLYAASMFKAPILLNGGAVLALLTFLGHFVSSSSTVSAGFFWPLGCFLLGLLLGSIGNVLGYLTQLTIFNMRMKSGDDFKRIGPSINPQVGFALTIGLIIGGLILFGIGAFLSLLELQLLS